MGSGKTEYVIGKRSISSGKKIHGPGKVVTAETMRLTDEQFKELLKTRKNEDEPRIISRKVKEVPKDPEVKKDPVKDPVTLSQNERYEKISTIIKEMHDKDGKPLNKEEFTGAGLPRVEVVTEKLKDVPGFKDGVSGPEVTAGLKLYEENRKK